MAALQTSYNAQSFQVIHPLNDVEEAKCASEGLGPIEMTRTVRLSLIVLRGYLIGMTLMLVFHVLQLADALPTQH